MTINILKDAGKIFAGLACIDNLRQTVTKIIIQPDEISSNPELSKSLSESLDRTKEWLKDVHLHLENISSLANDNSESTEETITSK